jgi:hypothetical protein
MLKRAACSVVGALALATTAFAAQGPTPQGVPMLDHVFLIMMENHGYDQIIGNANAPFINAFATGGNLATNYYAIGHPSLTNYLEVVGGSNFGVKSDNDTDWHSSTCTPNLATATANTDNPPSSKICPIKGAGSDAATPAVDTTNETDGAPGENNIDGTASVAAAAGTLGMTIADQLVAANRSWKSYQESLPFAGANNVNYSDGLYTDHTDFTTIHPTLNPPLAQGDVVKLYAAKHNPFVYFANVQGGGGGAKLSLDQTVDFDGPNGLYADLATGHVPNFAFIAPNQCNDQHGRGNAGAFCNFDPTSDGSQEGLNPALIQRGDVTVERLVDAIEGSRVWQRGRNAIILMWDENDYSTAPNTNQVVFAVRTNYGPHGQTSDVRYTHFSTLKTLEAAFGLPCLNHACDADVKVMSDLFAAH